MEKLHFCSEHRCKFYRNEKNGKEWYSHKKKDGSGYCNEPREEQREREPQETIVKEPTPKPDLKPVAGETPKPTPPAPQPKITPPKEESSISDRDRRIEHMVWIKEVGEFIRMWKQYPKTTPVTPEGNPQLWTTALIIKYQLEMLEGFDIKVEKEGK